MASKPKRFNAVDSVFGSNVQTEQSTQTIQTTPVTQTTQGIQVTQPIDVQTIQSKQENKAEDVQHTLIIQREQNTQAILSEQTMQSTPIIQTKQGTKGNPYKRINMGFPDEIHEYITIEGRKRGMWPSQFVNQIIAEYKENQEKK